MRRKSDWRGSGLLIIIFFPVFASLNPHGLSVMVLGNGPASSSPKTALTAAGVVLAEAIRMDWQLTRQVVSYAFEKKTFVIGAYSKICPQCRD